MLAESPGTGQAYAAARLDSLQLPRECAWQDTLDRPGILETLIPGRMQNYACPTI